MVTTPSGTYTIEQYKKIEKKISKGFQDFWSNKITKEDLEKIFKKSGLSRGEISSIQYSTSLRTK